MKAQLIQYLFFAVVCSWFGATAVHAIDDSSPIGLWKGDDATFEMFESAGKLSAKIVALSEPKTSEGKEKTDIHNPDPTKRNHPIIGLVFICGFAKKSDTRWENGTIYDPHDGKTYSCSMDLQGPNKIKVRGFIGVDLLGRNYIWTRAN
jgi:uncharacterized protein (DUF2147 family)